MSRTIPTWADSDAPTARLLVDGRDAGAPVWVARTRRERNTGLLGTDGLDGAVWIQRCNWVHCFGMRYPIDVVYLSRSNAVTAVVRMAPRRLGAPRPRAGAVVEMPAGAATAAGIVPGCELSLA